MSAKEMLHVTVEELPCGRALTQEVRMLPSLKTLFSFSFFLFRKQEEEEEEEEGGGEEEEEEEEGGGEEENNKTKPQTVTIIARKSQNPPPDVLIKVECLLHPYIINCSTTKKLKFGI